MRECITLLIILATACLASAARAVTLEEQLVHAALLQARPTYDAESDAVGALETRAEYDARIRLSVGALVEATTFVDAEGRVRTLPDWRFGAAILAASVLTHWYEESRFALEVHAGLRHPKWTQDRGKATCFGQLHKAAVGPDWYALAGTDRDSTRRCATWTARTLIRMALYCAPRATRADDVLLPMFSGLSGRGCDPTLSARRKVERYAKIWKSMREAARAPLVGRHEINQEVYAGSRSRWAAFGRPAITLACSLSDGSLGERTGGPLAPGLRAE